MGLEPTTVPSSRTSTTSGGNGALVIRWVHPEPDGPLTLLGHTPITVGRQSCDVELDGRQLSRHHATIERVGSVHVLRDEDSRNGIFLNGKRVTGEAPLSPGQVVRLGDVVGIVVRAQPAAGPSFRQEARHLVAGPTLQSVLAPARQAASSDLRILIQGETGTGKECIARAIHEWSGRSGPFVAVNCAELPEALAEAELYGYRRGAFTGAYQASDGRIRAAHGGTLLLDEVTDWPLTVQLKLLRVLEQREVIPIGETRPIPVDVRCIAAVQEPLDDAVSSGRLRADLRYRLEELVVSVPPLRDRIEEVPYLLHTLLREHAGGREPAVDARLVEQLCMYDLPGNVRELDKIVRTMLVLHGQEGLLKTKHLPKRIRVRQTGTRVTATSTARAAPPGVDRLLEAVRRHDGVLARAAAELGITRQRAYRLLEREGHDLDSLRSEVGAS